MASIRDSLKEYNAPAPPDSPAFSPDTCAKDGGLVKKLQPFLFVLKVYACLLKAMADLQGNIADARGQTRRPIKKRL